MVARQIRLTASGQEVAEALTEMEASGSMRAATPHFDIVKVATEKGLTEVRITRRISGTRRDGYGTQELPGSD